MGNQKAEQRGRRRGEQGSSLQSDHSFTRIEDAVVAKIAGVAAQEVEGIHMGGGASRAVGGLLESVTGTGGETRGVSVEVGETEAAIDLTLAMEYGRSIPQAAEAVRRNVVNRVENLVGLKVTEVNIAVDDIVFPEAGGEQYELTGDR